MSKLLQSPQETEKIWHSTLAKIRQELSDQSFKTWIEPTKLASFDGTIATISVPDKFYGDWIRDHFLEIIRECMSQIVGDKPNLAFQVNEPVKLPSAPTPVSAPSAPRIVSPGSAQDVELNGKYTFDHFVAGPGTRFAYAASMAISESPAKTYNPLFIYGSVGLGKTHLMQAIAHKSQLVNPQRKVCYITSEKFTNQLISAIQSRTTQQFRARYRFVDILLIDDIHFIAGKESTQEEFFHTFNALYDAHKQIVVTSDRPPRDIPGLEERLVSRFGWGLVTDIQPPDYETRVAILQKKMEKETVLVPDDVVHFIAKRIKSNIRELEGALIRVVAYSSLTGAPIDLKLAQEILKDTITEEESKITINLIQKKVADYFNLKVSDMRMKSRVKSVAFPRHVAMYLVRELTGHSLPEIGEFFGGRNHTTVLHAYQKIKEEMLVNSHVQNTIDFLIKQIKSDSY